MFYFFIVLIYCLLQKIIILIINNYSIYNVIPIIFFKIIINLNFLTLWFSFLILIILLIIIYNIKKKKNSFQKQIISIIIYTLIYININLIIITQDILFFIIFIENLIYPVLYISTFYCITNRFIFAIYYLIIFTCISSVLAIILQLIIIFFYNVSNIILLEEININTNFVINNFIFLLLWIMFGIKYPIWPLHIWLPELHVEVTTETSIILAAIVLKMGFIGIYNFIYQIFYKTNIYYVSFINILILIGIFIISLTIIIIIDYKKIIANWSVLHTCIGLILLIYLETAQTNIIIFNNLAHIISSAFMFFIISIYYDNNGQRNYIMFNTFLAINFITTLILFLFIFNIDFPFMILFYIEIFILANLINISLIYIIIILIIIILIFITSIYIYLISTFKTIVWNNFYFKTDLLINDIIVFYFIFYLNFYFYFNILNIL